MSHRVKNSLAVVAGLLALQVRGTENADVKNALSDARARVEAVAQVHDQLWRQPDITRIDLAGFLGALCEKLSESAGTHALRCRAAAVTMPADLAIPLGLFVNELVTNAIKYAYPDGQGEIRIEACPREDGGLTVAVADDGVGLPEGFDPLKSRTSLGMRVINNLARQLDGTLVLVPGRGARFELRMAPRA